MLAFAALFLVDAENAVTTSSLLQPTASRLSAAITPRATVQMERVTQMPAVYRNESCLADPSCVSMAFGPWDSPNEAPGAVVPGWAIVALTLVGCAAVAGALLVVGFTGRPSQDGLIGWLPVYWKMVSRVYTVLLTAGPKAALSWWPNHKRLRPDPKLKSEMCAPVFMEAPVVRREVREAIAREFEARMKSGKRNVFSQKSQTILYTHEFPDELKPELENLYQSLLEIVSKETGQKLYPTKANFAERVYAIDYMGPSIKLPFHYDSNGPEDVKCQILLNKSANAPSLWAAPGGKTCASVAPLPEELNVVNVFHPYSTYHGIPGGEGTRQVLLCTFTRIPNDRRPIVSHADLAASNIRACGGPSGGDGAQA